jgi:hypothetical protein
MLSRFVARSGWSREPVVDDPANVEDVRCVVQLRGAHGVRELIIATELGGGVRVVEGRQALPQRARTQLAFHEVASGRVLQIDADELWTFDLQTVEMLPDAPGFNDALYVYGVLRGPFPAALDAGVSTVPVEGQLTVTRADLLGGMLDGIGNAFAYAPEPNLLHGSRCVHALLPGERAEIIAAGRGVVLALPLVPGWELDRPVANDLVAAQLLYDVLTALRADLGVSSAAAPLPVPDRAALEHELRAAGWRIDGDQAVRSKGGLLQSLLKGGERRVLPKQGTLYELAAEARAALAQLGGVPTAEARALQARSSRPPSPLALGAASPPVPVAAPLTQPSPAVPVALAAAPSLTAPTAPYQPTLPQPARQPTPQVAAGRSEWMKDFVEAHRQPSRPPPRLSTPARAVTPSARPAWMEDFATSAEPAAAPTAEDPAEPTEPPSTRPDWSRDFD